MHEAESQDTRTLWVPMLEPEIVKQLRALAALKWGEKRIVGCRPANTFCSTSTARPTWDIRSNGLALPFVRQPE